MKIVVMLVTIFMCNAHRDHAVPSYFRRTDENGNFLYRQKEEQYNKDIPQHFISQVLQNDNGATLKVSPLVVNNGGKVTVYWNGVIKPVEKDFIALYCPITDNPMHYLDYFFVTVNPTWSDGYGNNTVVVYNMRTDCVFKYYRNNGYSQLVSVSNKLSFIGGSFEPLQGHIALTGKPSEMRVMWTSGKGNTQLMVRYGRNRSLSQVSTKVNVQTYSADSMCESPANSTGFWDPGYLYDALLEDLDPNTRYYYSFGMEGHMSRIYNFTTILPAGDRTPYKFITYGDMGLGPYPRSSETADLIVEQLLQNEDIRFIYHHGDISYACGYAYIWDQWMDLIQPYATLLPYMIGIGNHEYDHETGGVKHDPSGASGEGGFRPDWGNYGQDSGGECSVPMYKRFHMPDNGNAVWWYSFDYGMTHYIMMSSEHDFSPGSQQYVWIENDLSNVDRQKTPWVIFSGHRAMYCSESYPGDYVVSINMQRVFEDLLYKYKVDLALWSHYHAYERICKVYQGECRDDGITHIVVGSSGKNIDKDIWLPKKWSVYHNNDYGYGVVTIANTTSLKWEWIQNRSHKVLDHVWLHK